MDVRKQPIVVSSRFSVSITTASHIEGAILSVSHHGGGRACDLDGKRFPSLAAARAAAREHGYTRFYGRNTYGYFVQSRAARRRGRACFEWRYRQSQRQHAQS